ncbi:MAG: hypothetical protein ACE15C_03950 [Phycisphaerae bacterium]
METVLCANPVVQAIAIADGNRRRISQYAADFSWVPTDQAPFAWPTGPMSLADTFMIMFVSMFAYCTVSGLFLGRAKRLLRRNLS